LIIWQCTQKCFRSNLIFVHSPAGFSCICGGAFSKTCLKSSFPTMIPHFRPIDYIPLSDFLTLPAHMDGVPEDWLLFLRFAKFLLAHRCLSSSAFCWRRSTKTCVNTLLSFGTNGSSTWVLGTSALRFALEKSDKSEHHSMWYKFMIVKPSVIFSG